MANNWYNNLFGNNTPADPSTFDYDTAAQKVQRQRAAAQALQALGMQSNQGQFIKSGDFMGFAGGNTVGSTLARSIAAMLGSSAQAGADESQKQLNLDSQNAMTWALDPNNSPAAQRASAAQVQREAEMERQREIDRSNNRVQGGDYIDPQAQTQATVETNSVPVPTNADIKTSPLDTSSALKKAALNALSKTPPGAKQQAVTNTPSQSVTGGPETYSTGADFNKTLGPKSNLPVAAKGPLSADDIAFASKLLSGDQGGNAPIARQDVTKTTHYAKSAYTVPPLPVSNQASPETPQVQAPQIPPAPSPQAALEERARALGMDPTATRGPGDPTLADQVAQVEAINKQMANGNEPQTDSRSLVDQARDQGNANASYGDKMAALQQLARTGPFGQQLANAQMQQMFTHADRYEVKLNDAGDAIRLDKWTGNVEPVKGMTNTLKVDQADIERRKLVDPNNTQSVSEYNAWRQQRGMNPIAPDTIAGSNMSADSRHAANKGDADSISAITTRRGEAAAQVADLKKINSDLQYAMTIANQAAGKWNGIAGSISQWFGGGQEQQILNRILNDSTLMSIMQDKGGSGTAGSSLFGAYQQHGMKATMTPQALMQGLQQIQGALSEHLAAKQAEVGAHDFALGKLGYQSNQQPQQNGAPAATGRAPGNYSF